MDKVGVGVTSMRLERLSQQMGRSTVAAMLEEAASITRRHRLEGFAHRLYERLAGARPGSRFLEQ
jgi:predicted ATPase